MPATVPGLKPRTPYGGGAANIVPSAPDAGGGTPSVASTTQMFGGGRNPTLPGGFSGQWASPGQQGGLYSAGATHARSAAGGTYAVPGQSSNSVGPQVQAPNTSYGGTPYDFGSNVGGGGGGGGLDFNQVSALLDKLAPSTPPVREQAPGLLPREADPEAVASPSAKSQGFARAKDNAGRIANAALKNLRSEMISRGIEGSGVEGALTGNILGETARGVADASFEQEHNAENQQWEARKLGYQGRLGQRAGDQGFLQNNYSIGTQQRGQDVQAQQARLSLAPTVLSYLNRARY